MEKEVFKFKITLLLMPIIPAVILWYKSHIQLAIAFTSILWGILAGLAVFNLLGRNIDEPVYKTVKKILKYIGAILSSTALIFTWFFAIFPTGIIALLSKRDRLNLKSANEKTYWKDFKEKEPSYENQY